MSKAAATAAKIALPPSRFSSAIAYLSLDRWFVLSPVRKLRESLPPRPTAGNAGLFIVKYGGTVAHEADQ